MKWNGDSDIKWISPLRNILCIFNGEVVNFEFCGLKSTNYTYGHKILVGLDKKIEISSFNDYKNKMAENFVIFDQNEREKIINRNEIEEIIKIAKENRVEKIVVGVPVNMDGTLGFQAQNCIDFSQKLLGFDIILEDERLTSEEAEERLPRRKVDFRKNKGLVDIESACVILEQYLGK